MKCKFLLITFLAFCLNVFSQNVSDVIYIDFNSSSKSLSEIEDEVKSITKGTRYSFITWGY